MSFLRMKKVKGKEYGYLVKNEWKKGKVRQEFKRYLGRVFRLEIRMGKDFFDYFKILDLEDYFKNKRKRGIINDLVEWELIRHGLRKERGCFIKERGEIRGDKIRKIKINKKMKRKGKSVVLKMNEGYLCDYTIGRILRYRKCGDIEEDSVELARRFVDAGLEVPKEVFIRYFEIE